ncbi:MAG TPA: glutamine synthetase [Gammaproteobacteria bacterium]|nr:glutamine synthetase [Gammaproteobacteria bacterium]
MATSTERVRTFLRSLAAREARFLRFELPDLHGIARVKVVPVNQAEGFLRSGLNMYGGTVALDTASAIVPGTGLNEEVCYRDQILLADLDTLAPVPWLPGTWKVICDAHWSATEAIDAAPRQVLKRVLASARALGVSVVFGHEYEFYLLDPRTREPLFGGVHIFNATRNHHVPFLDTLLEQLMAAGIDVTTHNCEYAPSQFEVNFAPTEGLAAADKAFTFKNAVKELAHRAGLLASFMSKPAAGLAGSGGHVHVSLKDLRTGKPLFHDTRARRPGPNAALAAFTQGMLDHAAAVTALAAPTPNCYRRFRRHTFAPSNVGWGIEDRSAFVRLKALGTPAARPELRAASGLSNPYLSAAAVLAAGLAGLAAQRELSPASEGLCEMNAGLPALPADLSSALTALAADTLLVEALGPAFVHSFCTVKRHELARLAEHVSDWERNEYLEVY